MDWSSITALILTLAVIFARAWSTRELVLLRAELKEEKRKRAELERRLGSADDETRALETELRSEIQERRAAERKLRALEAGDDDAADESENS